MYFQGQPNSFKGAHANLKVIEDETIAIMGTLLLKAGNHTYHTFARYSFGIQEIHFDGNKSVI